MGCTSSNQLGTTKENTSLPPPTIVNDGQQLINDNFRKWLKTNRPKADEYVLHDVLTTAQPANEFEDYQAIVGKALDLLTERHDIKSTNKLGKLIQKEIVLASPKKVAHTINVLKETADKLRDGNIELQQNEQTSKADQFTTDKTTSDNQDIPVVHGEPGIALKEALEKARCLFYKGKQAAIFANPNGGYDVRILNDNDEKIKDDGNLLRSIVVTEVKMRPKTTTVSSPLFIPPPPPTTPPPSSSPEKLLDEHEITEEFRHSIDIALKGLESVYQTGPTKVSSPIKGNGREIHVEKVSRRTPSPSVPFFLQCGVTNAPLPKSISKEQTKLLDVQTVPTDNTTNLTEIIRQMAEQQKIVSEILGKSVHEAKFDEFNDIDIQPKLVDLVNDVNELMMDAIEATTCSEIGNSTSQINHETIGKIVTTTTSEQSEGEIERIVKQIKEHGEKCQTKEYVPSMAMATKQLSSYSLGLTSPLQNETTMTSSVTSPTRQKTKLRSESRPKSFIANEEVNIKDRFVLNKQISLDELAHLTQTGLSNPNLTTSITKLGISTSSGKIEEEEPIPIVTSEPLAKVPTSISQIIEEHHTIIDELPATTTHPASPLPTSATSEVESTSAAVAPVDIKTKLKSPSHNVTYTEIIHSESRDGEQTRHFITESYDEHPSKDDEQTTTLKVITKSEFSNDPTSGEKIMEQSVQVITVKVRNETIKTTIQQASLPSTTDSDAAYERRPVSELVKNFEVVAATGGSMSVNT